MTELEAFNILRRMNSAQLDALEVNLGLDQSMLPPRLESITVRAKEILRLVSSPAGPGVSAMQSHFQELKVLPAGTDPIQNKSTIDLAIIGAREDEIRAVLRRIKRLTNRPERNRTYKVGTVERFDGERYTVAVVKTPEQGPNAAQDTTRDLIEDLDPRWILVVGIAGAVPEKEFTLGDVVVASRLHDFTVGAHIEGRLPEAVNQGRVPKKEIQDLIQFIPMMDAELSGWQTPDAIGLNRPGVSVELDRFYGEPATQTSTRLCLEHSFVTEGRRNYPIVTTRSVASSGFLLKDTRMLDRWRQDARDLAAVEMELAGVFTAAARKYKEYPVLGIRGISDVVGFRRDSAWTTYACETAASFCMKLVTHMPAHFLQPRL